MQFPWIYIQIPHYNNAPFLKECLTNVSQIEYPNFHSILINDCSTDHTKETLSTINLPNNIAIIHNVERLGRVGNYQFAFKQRKHAKWLINKDSDDYYTDNSWIKTAMQIVQNNPNDKIVHIQSNFLARIEISKTKIIKDYGDGYYLISGYEYVKLCIQYYGFSHLSSIFNVELIEKYGAYSDECLHTDFLTAARAAIQGNVIVGSKEIGVWRKHDGNQSVHRYSEEEYVKNQIAYYRFFEWCENFLSFKQVRKLTTIFENREFDRKLVSTIQKRNFRELSQFFLKENFSIWPVILSLIRIFISDFSYAKLSYIGHGLITRGASVLITLIVLPYIIKQLGVAEYSWIGVFTTISSAIYIFDFGLTNIVTKEITQKGLKSKDHLKTIIASQEVIYLAIGIFIFFVLLFSSNWLTAHWFFSNSGMGNTQNLMRLIAFAILMQWPHSFYTGVLFGLNKQALSNYTQVGLTALKNFGTIFLFYSLAPSIELFFYWHISISFLTILIQKFFIYKETQFINPLRFFSTSYLGQLKHLALGISFISIFGFIYGDVNNFLLTRWLSKTEFGYYAILYNIIMAFIMYCATVKSALFPYISKLLLSEPNEVIKNNYYKHTIIISYTLIPICIALIVFRMDILTLWLTNVDIVHKLNTSFGYITAGSLFNALMIIPWTYLIAMSRPKFLIYLTGFIALLSIPLLYFLIYHFEFEGASLYWLIINILPLPVLIYYFHSLIQFDHAKYFLHLIFVPIVFSTAFLYTTSYVLNTLQLHSIANIAICVLALAVTYFSILSYKFFVSKHKF